MIVAPMVVTAVVVPVIAVICADIHNDFRLSLRRRIGTSKHK